MKVGRDAEDDDYIHRLHQLFAGQAMDADFIPPAYPLVNDGHCRDAAVLIPLIRGDGGNGSRLLLTRRTDTLRSHAGQVALPGGTCDPEDCDPVATALRESQEEIGLPPSAVEIIGQLAPVRLPSGYRVTPVVGLVSASIKLRPAPDEVAAIFQPPASLVLDPGNYRKFSMTYRDRPREVLELYYREFRIWGATAAILHGLGEKLKRL